MVCYCIKCPSCSAEALAEMRPIGVAGTYREATSKMGARKIICTHCGFCKDISLLRSGEYELWFVAEFKGHRLWAVNREHLGFLISWFSGEISEADLSLGKRAMVEVFPKWMIQASNKAAVLKCLRRMSERNSASSR